MFISSSKREPHSGGGRQQQQQQSVGDRMDLSMAKAGVSIK